jgi:hypothetical protein
MKFMHTSKPDFFSKKVMFILLGCLFRILPVQAAMVDNPIEKTVQENQSTAVPAGVTAGNDGPLTCMNAYVTLTGTSTTPGVTYSWNGPGGYSSHSNVAITSLPGIYTLTVTDPSNGSTATATTEVIRDITTPDVTASSSNTLTCIRKSVTLKGSSTTVGVTYNWSGPNGYTSTVQNPLITDGGNYTLKVINPVNNCFAIKSIVAQQDTVKPANVEIYFPTKLDCNYSWVTISGSSSTPNMEYLWTTPDGEWVYCNTAVLDPDQGGSSGSYLLKVRNPINGCFVDKTATVPDNWVFPTCNLNTPNGSEIPAATVNTITTTYKTSYVFRWSIGVSNSLALSGNASPALTYKAENAGSQINISLDIMDIENGCTGLCWVQLSTVAPSSSVVTANNNGPLTCQVTSVTLAGSSMIPGAIYSWTGPNGFSASSATTTTSVPGTYSLQVTNPTNGSISIATTIVTQDLITPLFVSIERDMLTCSNTIIPLIPHTAIPGLTYSWSGPNGFTSYFGAGNTNNFLDHAVNISIPGNYTLTVTNPLNHCSTTVTTEVRQNIIDCMSSTSTGIKPSESDL